MTLSIGEFSRTTSLTVKSLRLYHERGILVPVHIDSTTGYRYYDERNLETANVIAILRSFDFSLGDIKSILDEMDDDSQLHEHLLEKKREIEAKVQRYRKISDSIDEIIRHERETAMYNEQQFEIEEKELETRLIAGYRITGSYDEIGKGFHIIGKKMGRYICGKAMALYFDSEYKEKDATFEACYPVRKGQSTDNISIRELAGGLAVTVLHKGPYETLGNSYQRLFHYIEQNGYRSTVPSREVYVKGPGMIFKGNAKNYLTEIQMLVSKK